MFGVKMEGRCGTNDDFVDFEIEEVNYITVTHTKSNSQIPIYHTSVGPLATLVTLKDISKALYPKGFRYMEKSTIVNKKRISRVIRSKGEMKIIFVDNQFTTVSSRSRYK